MQVIQKGLSVIRDEWEDWKDEQEKQFDNWKDDQQKKMDEKGNAYYIRVCMVPWDLHPCICGNAAAVVVVGVILGQGVVVGGMQTVFTRRF